MGVTRQQTWEGSGQAAGDTITATTSALTGDATAVLGSTGTRQLTTTRTMHGAFAARIAPASSSTTGLGFTGLATTSPELTASGSGYFLFEALPVGTCSIFLAYTTGSGSPAFRVRVSSAGLVQISDVGGTTWTTIGTAAVETFYRIDFVATIGTTTADGVIVAAMYLGDSQTPLTSVVTRTGANVGSVAWSNLQWGKLSSGTETFASDWDTVRVVTGSTALLGPYVPPATGRAVFAARPDKALEFATIGDSTLYDSGNGETKLRDRLTLNGYDPAKLYFYAASGKAIDIADTNGKTTVQNIADVQAFFGGRNPTGGYLLNLGSNGHNSAEATNRARVAAVMAAIGSTTRVVWVGLANLSTHADAATRAAFNVLMQDILTAHPNAEWYDQQRFLSNWDQATMWTDGVHHTTVGAAVKFGGLITHLPAPSTSVVPATILRGASAAAVLPK